MIEVSFFSLLLILLGFEPRVVCWLTDGLHGHFSVLTPSELVALVVFINVVCLVLLIIKVAK